MIICGIDPSSVATGISFMRCTRTPTIYRAWTVKPRSDSRPERLRKLLSDLEEVLEASAKEDGERIALAVVEAGSVGRFARPCLVVSEARGIVLALSAKYAERVVEVQVQSARKALGVSAFGQRRKDGKDATRSAIRELFGEPFGTAATEDEIDAAAMAWWGYLHFDELKIRKDWGK